MKNIIIIGGGISGLTAAHELVKYGYKIIIIERNDIVGGLARTYQNEKKKICPIEYSWRAYGPWYQNVYHIMKQIPFNDKESVFDQLTILQGGAKTCNKKIPNYQKTMDHIPFKDKIKILPYFIQYNISCKERNIDNFSHISLKKFLYKLKVSKYTEDSVGKIVGPYLGFEYTKSSLYDLLYFYEMMITNSSSKYNFNITKYPTNYAWFEPWVKYLSNNKVKIYTNTEVQNIFIQNNKIQYILIKNKFKKYQKIKADYYINCTGPEVLEKILRPYKNIYNNYYLSIDKVKKYGHQIQLSVYYYLNKKIFLDRKNTLSYLPNTPWLLMVLPTGHIWGDNYLKKYCDSKIKEVISIGICEPYVKGRLIKKPWSECTPEEIKIESWNQLINDKDFINNICIENNSNINEIKIVDFKMWHSYKYNGNIETYEPKWANNINTAKYRPNSKSPIDNLIIAGSYTNTSTGCYSMESACESGKIAAKTLCQIDNNVNNIYIHTKKTFIISNPFRTLDYLIYKKQYLKLFILVMLLIFIIVFIISGIKRLRIKKNK